METASHRQIKWSHATHVLQQLPLTVAELPGRIQLQDGSPRANDVIVAEVVEIGHHLRLELRSGPPSVLFTGDVVGVVYANRYATRQWQGVVPKHGGLCHLLSVGGICGEVVAKARQMKDPTTLRPLGYLVDGASQRVNLIDHGLHPCRRKESRPTTILVVGSAMDSGKTTAAYSVIQGLMRSGARVCAGKLTGTASCKDALMMRDAGAVKVLDFTDAGFASTAGCSSEQLWSIVKSLGSHLNSLAPDYLVLEIADGIVQRETKMLLNLLAIHQYVDYVIYTCNDCLGIKGGVRRIRKYGFKVAAVSGWAACSQLAIREAQDETDLPVLGAEQLSEPGVAALFARVTLARKKGVRLRA
jgi:hypothetical protein